MPARPDAAPITLLASRVRQEEKWIMAALEASGVGWQHVDPRRLQLSAADGAPPGVYLVRDIAQHRAAIVADALAGPGRHVVNTASAIRTCANKWSTAVALAAADVPSPRTWLVTDATSGVDLVDRVGYPVVVKPQVSSWGRRVSMITDRHAATAVLEHCEALPTPEAKLPLVQEYVPHHLGDVRVLVVGGRAVAAEVRRSPDAAQWRHNVARGALVEPFDLDASPAVADLSVAAAHAVGAEIAGVDLVRRADGTWLVLEVNAGVEFAGLERATGCDAASHVVALCVERALGARTVEVA